MSNKGLPGVWMFLRLIVDPGWAPIAVAVAFLLSVGSGYAESHDYVFHTAGGAAIAYFALRTASIVPSLSKRVSLAGRPAFAFLAAMTVALLWEVAEFCADQWLGASLQGGIFETLRDVAFGAIGALVVAVAARLLARPVRGGQGPTK
jgi:hypothetical protein